MRPSQPIEPGSDYAAHGARIVHEKLQILRVLRGLDRIGIDPGESPELRAALVRLAEIDQMLTMMLEVLERDGCKRPNVGKKRAKDSFPGMLMLAEQVRAEVRDALDDDDQGAFGRALGEVAAVEPEIWMQVDELRERSGKSSRSGRGKREPMLPMSDDEVADLGARAWNSTAKERREANHPKAVAFERESLPGPQAPLLDWLTRLPPEWLRGIARMHDLDPVGIDPLAQRVAARLVDREWIARFLGERTGASERERLAWLLHMPQVIPPGSEESKAFSVPWDWRLERPASTGGKLRSSGFVHVGVSDAGVHGVKGRRPTLAIVPPPIAALLREALERVAPDALHLPAAKVGSKIAEHLDGTPFDDPELDRWKAADRSVCRLFEEWAIAAKPSERGAEAYFGSAARELSNPSAQTAFFNFLIFDWREKPGAPTTAEAAFPTTSFASGDERAIALAVMATRPALYRVDSIERGVGFDARSVYPPGPVLRVTERAMSLSLRAGQLIPLRLVPVGPYHFAHFAGDPIAHGEEAQVERALRRKAGSRDPVEFVARDPGAFYRAVRAYRAP